MVSSAMMKLHGVLPWTKNKTKNKIPFSLLHSTSHHYQHSKLILPFSVQHSQNGCQAQKYWLMEKVRMSLMARFPLAIMSKTPGYFHSYFHTTKRLYYHSIPCLLTSYTPQLETFQGTALILVCSHVARLPCW